jgi:hypothetical protein
MKEAERVSSPQSASESRQSMIVPKTGNSYDDEINQEVHLGGDFYYSLIKPSSRSPRDKPLIHETYRCWKDVWSATLKELDGAERVYSDDFARQQEFVALFHGDRCIGMVGFRFVDLATEIATDDSYFKCWPAHAMARVRASSRPVCLMSNLTVHPDYRGGTGDVSVKELLTILSLHRFSRGPAGCSTGLVTTRNNRGVNDLMARYGATTLVHDAVLHGVKVDLVAFSRWTVRTMLGRGRPGSIVAQLVEPSQRRTA